MTVELDFDMYEDGNALAVNYPEGDKWIIDIFLKKLRARKNTNIENLAKKINFIYLQELLCIQTQKLFKNLNDEQYEKCFCKPIGGCVMKSLVMKMK
jgi:hypothetical protein